MKIIVYKQNKTRGQSYCYEQLYINTVYIMHKTFFKNTVKNIINTTKYFN